MALNETGLEALAALLKATIGYAQLHSAGAGVNGTDNICVTGRLPITWGVSTNGSFGLQSPLRFIAGTPDSPVHSVTLWDSELDGVFYGECPLSGGDGQMNLEGEFIVTALDFLASSTDA